MSELISLDPVNPDPEVIAHAGRIIRQGGVVIFPAKCLYGVAANALEPQAVEKVFNLKQRPKDMPILVLIKNSSALPELAQSIPEPAKRLIQAFWPGNLTLVFKAKKKVSSLLTAGTGKIGIRIPSHPVAKALADNLDCPITGTSANISGQPGCSRLKDLHPSILDSADLILDAGPVKGGTGSSIVDVTCSPPRVLREGEVSKEQIAKALQFH